MRRRLRQERSKPIVDGLLTWALEHRGSVLPKSKMGRAVADIPELWEGMPWFLDGLRESFGDQPVSRGPQVVIEDVPVLRAEVGSDVDDRHPLEVHRYRRSAKFLPKSRQEQAAVLVVRVELEQHEIKVLEVDRGTL